MFKCLNFIFVKKNLFKSSKIYLSIPISIAVEQKHRKVSQNINHFMYLLFTYFYIYITLILCFIFKKSKSGVILVSYFNLFHQFNILKSKVIRNPISLIAQNKISYYLIFSKRVTILKYLIYQ